jgi:hypothetical protein
MSYTLEQFCKDCHDTLAADPGHSGRDKVRQKLEKLLQNKEFTEAYLGEGQPEGRRTIYEDPDLGFCVLTYNMADPRTSPPHDHGTSWATYGQVAEYTDMTEYRRVSGGDGAGDAKLEQVNHYRLTPGKAGLYDTGAIHAIDYPAGAKFVRVTGKDLERVPRLKFDTSQGKAIEIAAAGVDN